MGQPTGSYILVSLTESIGQGGKPRELKHLSTWRKRKKFDSPSSGERTGNSPNPAFGGGLWDSNMGPEGIAERDGKPGHRQ